MKRSRDSQEEEEGSSQYPQGYASEFKPTNSHLRVPAKFLELDPEAVQDEDDDDDDGIGPHGVTIDTTMKCSLPPHREVLQFATYEDYEVHYSKAHSHRCHECGLNFPSDHILEVHIEELHDPLVAVKRDRGDHTFSCFEKDCERKCRTAPKRRMHLIDKHHYPKNYFFAVTVEGIDGIYSLLVDKKHTRRRSSAYSRRRESQTHNGEEEKHNDDDDENGKNKTDAMDLSTTEPAVKDQKKKTEEAPASAKPVAEKKAELPEQAESNDPPDTEMDDLADSMSSLKFIPTSVRFGRGRGRAGFAKR